MRNLRRARILETLCALLAFPLYLVPQTSNTVGACSPISPYNQGLLQIQCTVGSEKEAERLLETMNKILANQTNPQKLVEDQQARDACGNSLAAIQAANQKIDILAKYLLTSQGRDEIGKVHVNLRVHMMEFTNTSDAVKSQKASESSPKK